MQINKKNHHIGDSLSQHVLVQPLIRKKPHSPSRRGIFANHLYYGAFCLNPYCSSPCASWVPTRDSLDAETMTETHFMNLLDAKIGLDNKIGNIMSPEACVY
jgi:hypothetical protein